MMQSVYVLPQYAGISTCIHSKLDGTLESVLQSHACDISDQNLGHPDYISVSPREQILDVQNGCGPFGEQIARAPEVSPSRQVSQVQALLVPARPQHSYYPIWEFRRPLGGSAAVWNSNHPHPFPRHRKIWMCAKVGGWGGCSGSVSG